jgi:uncharacterized membrane protein YccC
MIERTLIRIAIAAGAAWWLVRVVLSRSERRKLDHAIQAIGEATVERAARDNPDLPRSFVIDTLQALAESRDSTTPFRPDDDNQRS